MESILSKEPYPGLPAFSRYQYDIFFGRDDHIDAMLAKLGASNFLCVTGSSGCGKSSLARTGLFNALEAGFLRGQGSDWVICDFSPGDAPLKRLVRSLAQGIILSEEQSDPTADERKQIEELEAFFHNQIEDVSSDLNLAASRVPQLGDRPVVILVDQFEELFRFAQVDRHKAARFVDILLKTSQQAGRIFVVFTVRTEELSKCARYPGLTEAINGSQFLTPTLDRYQLQEAIEGPIRLFGGEIEPRLTVRILNDLERELDKLPLMQHALKRLYNKKREEDPDTPPVIGLDDLNELFSLKKIDQVQDGPRRSALREVMSNQLDGIYKDLPKDLRRVAARAFCALTNVASQGRDIRKPLNLRELAEIINVDVDKAIALVKEFSEGDTGYLRHDGPLDAQTNPKIDVTHECVLRLWHRLQERWLPIEIKNAQILKEVARRAYRHKELHAGRKGWIARLFDDRLLRGSELEGYEGWWNEAKPNAAWAQRYLADVNDEIRRTRDTKHEIETEVTFSDVRAFMKGSKETERNQSILTRGAAVAALSLVLFVVGYFLSERARNEQAAADQRTKSAATNAVTALDPSELNPLPTDTIAFGIKVVDLAHKANVDEETLIEARNKLWFSNVHSFERKRLRHKFADKNQVRAADFAENGNKIVTLTRNGVLRVWSRSDTSKPQLEIPLNDETYVTHKGAQWGRSMRVAPNGGIAAVGTWRGTVALVDLKTGEVRELHPGPPNTPTRNTPASVLDLSFSSDGRAIAAASLDGIARIWVKTGQAGLEAWELQTQIQHNSTVYSVGLNDDGRLLGAGLGNGRVCLSTTIGIPDTVCDGQGHFKDQAVKAIAFRPGGDYMVSAGNDDRAIMWSIRRVPKSRMHVTVVAGPVIWHDSDVWDVGFDRSGQYLATISWDGAIRIFDADTWKPLRTMYGHTRTPRTIRFGPKAQNVISASLDGTARIWSPFAALSSDEAYSHRFGTPLPNGTHRDVRAVSFGPDAAWIVLTDGRDVFVKPADGPIRSLVAMRNADGVRFKFRDLDTSDAGAIVASTTEPEVLLWRREGEDARWTPANVDLRNGNYLQSTERRAVALSPDAGRVAVGLHGKTGEEHRYAFAVCDLPAGERNISCNAPPVQLARTTDESVSSGCRANAPRVNELAFSPDGNILAVGGWDCVVRLFDVSGEIPKEMGALTGHVGAITDLHFSKNGDTIITGSADNSARVMPLDGSAQVQLVGPHSAALTAARLSPSGQHAATVSIDEKLVIWDVSTGEPLTVLPGHKNSIYALDIGQNTDGQVLMATGSQNGELQVIPYFDDAVKLREFSRRNILAVVGEEELQELIASAEDQEPEAASDTRD